MTDLEHRLRAVPAAGPDIDATRLGEALSRRAAAEHLLDVAYGELDSPLGRLTVFVTPAGLLRISYDHDPLDDALDEITTRVSPRILRSAAATDGARRELDEYFAGRRHDFETPVDWRLIRGFASGVLHATARVPFGQVTTYRQVATEAGSPRAARAAGNALASNPIPIVVPCHRVLHADGGLGGYSGGLDRKRFLLRLEGVLPGA